MILFPRICVGKRRRESEKKERGDSARETTKVEQWEDGNEREEPRDIPDSCPMSDVVLPM